MENWSIVVLWVCRGEMEYWGELECWGEKVCRDEVGMQM